MLSGVCHRALLPSNATPRMLGSLTLATCRCRAATEIYLLYLLTDHEFMMVGGGGAHYPPPTTPHLIADHNPAQLPGREQRGTPCPLGPGTLGETRTSTSTTCSCTGSPQLRVN